MEQVKIEGKDKKNVNVIILAALQSGQDEVEVVIDGETHTIRLKKKDAEGRELIQE